MKPLIMFLITLLSVIPGSIMDVCAQQWVPDLGNGYFKNPVIFADYSDPDVIRVDSSFYLVASSFNTMPGIPVLHSIDLINWTLIGHVYDSLPFPKYDKPAHGQGSWAPSIRFFQGRFYVYFCTPHEGLFMAVTDDPTGPWELHQVVAVELWEDPCPFWDDDGNAYLVRGKVQADILYIHKMTADGKRLLDNGTIIYDDTTRQPTIEGPKLFKKDDYYYILAPAGGVRTGWQTALRSKNIYGPYEEKIVLHQGNTSINGPHQGGIVDLKSGEWWFVHFQDRGLYGRIVHLQPVKWINGWPLMGEDRNGDGIGEPVLEWKKPNIEAKSSIRIPQTTDEFETEEISPQWQWHANPKTQWYSLTYNPGCLRLFAIQNLTQNGNLWFVPNLLLQKFPAPVFRVTTQIHFFPEQINERSGLVVMGRKWSFIALTNTDEGIRIGMFRGTYIRGYDATQEIESFHLGDNTCFLRVDIDHNGLCKYSYSLDGVEFKSIGKAVSADQGVWIGAKVGLFNINPNIIDSHGYADFDWFRFE